MLCCRSHLRTVYKFFNSSVRKALEMVRVINKLWKLSGRKYRLSLSIHSNLLNIKCNLISVNIRIFYFPSVQCNKHRPSINESENRKRKKKSLFKVSQRRKTNISISHESAIGDYFGFLFCVSRDVPQIVWRARNPSRKICVFFLFSTQANPTTSGERPQGQS